MRYLTQTGGEASASVIKSLLEEKGIPVVVQNEGLRRNRSEGPTFRSRIFVCLDSQYDDACALLKNANHVVANPVNAREYHEWAAAQPLSRYLTWGAPVALVGVVAFVLLVAWLTGSLGGA